jgi:hypothetical protein
MREVYEGMQILEKHGVSVKYFVDADTHAKAGTDLLAKLKNPVFYETRGPLPADRPKVIVVGTSATAVSGQVAWTEHGHKNGIPVVWVEDLWGTGERAEVLSVRPDEMLVIDEIAARIAVTVRPRLKTTVVGKPSFGELPSTEETVGIRAQVRSNLGLSPEDFLLSVGFGGDPAVRTITQLPLLLKLFQAYNVVVAWRFHPKHPDATMLWEHATQSGIRSVDARSVDLTNLYIASDLVVADWGHTDAYKAVICGIPTVTMLFPDDTERRNRVGYPEGIPPIIATDLEWGARDVSEVGKLLQKSIAEGERIRSYTLAIRAKPFLDLVKPGAADRIADEVMKYLK